MKLPSGRVARRVAKLTFSDAGVLIAAARGGNIQAARAMEVFDDPRQRICRKLFPTLAYRPQPRANAIAEQT